MKINTFISISILFIFLINIHCETCIEMLENMEIPRKNTSTSKFRHGVSGFTEMQTPSDKANDLLNCIISEKNIEILKENVFSMLYYRFHLVGSLGIEFYLSCNDKAIQVGYYNNGYFYVN